MAKRLLPAFAWVLIVVFAAPCAVFAAADPVAAIRKGPGVTSVWQLSRYHAPLQGSPGDSPVYVLDSGKPGGSALIVGGTHGNEPAGYMAAIVMIETATPAAGRLFILPFANLSALNNPAPRNNAPRSFAVATPGGERIFPYGGRLSNPDDQNPDPDNYLHPRSRKAAAGSTARNLNRLHPGKADGSLTEQVAYAVAQMIRQEKIGMSIDLHEANPDSPLRNVLIAHERGMDVAADAVLALETEGIELGLDVSPPQMWGLSHREWGDNTETLAILMETVNPAQGKYAKNATADIIVNGRKGQNALGERVARHVSATLALLEAYAGAYPGQAVVVRNVPGFTAIRENLGGCLLP